MCQYWYSSSNNDWLVRNELEQMCKEVVTACLKYHHRQKPMKICQASWCHGQDSHQVLPSEPITSVDLYNIIHHRYQNKCLIHIAVYLSMSKP